MLDFNSCGASFDSHRLLIMSKIITSLPIKASMLPWSPFYEHI